MRVFSRAVQRWFGAAVGVGMVVGVVAAGPGAAPAHAAGTVPNFDHIFTIMMENHSYNEIIGSSQAPYINGLASQYGLATNYFGVSHPSLPNYLASTGGSTFGVTSDCTTCFQAQPNIAADRVEPSGRSWKAYMDSMPSPCFVGDSGEYAQKHDPFIYYNDIRTNTTECNKIVPYTQLSGDLVSTSTTANYVWITPNLINDMHDGTIAQGDTWLSQNVPAILNSPAFTTQNSLLMITWDEDDSSQNNQVPMLMISSKVGAGTKSAVQYGHYSMLSTIESAWGLSPLTTNDGSAPVMSDFFGSTTTPPAFTADTPPTAATVGTPYSYTFAASGSPAPTFAVASGSLPAGLSLNPTSGVLSGTPTTAGPSTFTISATNSAGTATTPSITINVASNTTPPAFTADTPPTAATVGTAYSYTFAASGSPAPTFAVASGSLPAGLSLNATSGVLSGIPTTAGPSTFTISATNSAGTATTPSITINVAAASTVPGAPTNVSAVANRHGAATVSWTAPASNGGCSISAYTVTSSPGGRTASASGTSTSARVTGLTTGTTYTFTVTASNCAGTGPASAPSNSIVARK